MKKYVQKILFDGVLANLLGESNGRFQKEIKTSIGNIVLNVKNSFQFNCFFS